MAGPSYTYSPIGSAGPCRLLNLLPGVGDAPLSVELIIASPDYTPPYTALSYVWGDMTPSETILCAGKSLPITHSLKCALRGIRSATESINVWADQLCINQSDVHERNDQVRAMDRVYARSGGIVAWLGADEEQIAEKAFGLLKDLYSRFFEGNDRKNATEIAKLAELERDDVRTFETPEWFALAKLYHQPWVCHYPRHMLQVSID